MHRNAGPRLARLLEQECAALRTGELSALPQIAVKKAKVLIDLENEKTTTSHLAKIRALAARNEALLAAAIRGVKTARDRVAELQNVRNDLRVYGKDGALLQTKKISSAMEHKA